MQDEFKCRERKEEFIPLELKNISRLQDKTIKEYTFSSDQICYKSGDNREYRFYFTGETDTNPEWRCEVLEPVLYRRISESLIWNENEYILKMQSDGTHEKAIHYKIYGDELEKINQNALFGFSYKTENIEGKILGEMQAEVYLKQDKPRQLKDCNPDYTIAFSLKKQKDFVIEQQKIRCSGAIDFVYISAVLNFKGVIFLKTPFFLVDGVNYIKPFSIEEIKPKSYRWIGENLSVIENPYFEVRLNDHTIFEGQDFERMFRWPSHEFLLPKKYLKEGKNILTLQYKKLAKTVPDFLLKDAYIIKNVEQGIVASGRYARQGDYPVFIRTIQDNTMVECVGDEGVKPVQAQIVFKEPGLHIVHFTVKPFEGAKEISITINGIETKATIRRYIEKTFDDIITGTGDMIYIHLDIANFEKFLQWYVDNGIGNMMTFRTTYRWSGTIGAEKGFWEKAEKLLSEAGIRYNLMVDGRDP